MFWSRVSSRLGLGRALKSQLAKLMNLEPFVAPEERKPLQISRTRLTFSEHKAKSQSLTDSIYTVRC